MSVLLKVPSLLLLVFISFFYVHTRVGHVVRRFRSSVSVSSGSEPVTTDPTKDFRYVIRVRFYDRTPISIGSSRHYSNGQ